MGSSGTIRGILCQYDDCLVSCNGAGEAVGGSDSLSGEEGAVRLGTSKDHSEGSRELSDYTGTEGIFEEFEKINCRSIPEYDTNVSNMHETVIGTQGILI